MYMYVHIHIHIYIHTHTHTHTHAHAQVAMQVKAAQPVSDAVLARDHDITRDAIMDKHYFFAAATTGDVAKAEYYWN